MTKSDHERTDLILAIIHRNFPFDIAQVPHAQLVRSAIEWAVEKCIKDKLMSLSIEELRQIAK